MIPFKDKINDSSSSPIADPTLGHKLKINMTLAPFARKTTGSNPDMSSEGSFLAFADE